MVESIARITLDVQGLSTSVTVSAKHGDTGRKIVIALSDGGFPYEVGPDCYAVLTAEKPDGSILFNHCDIEGNCIVYAFTEQTTAVVGVFPCEVKLYGADDALITTARFRIIVDGTVYNDGRVESKDEISALTHLISQVSESKENAEQAAEDGAAAVQSSLLALENADEAIRTANTAANNANLAAEEANKYLPVATEALQTAGAAVQTANEAKQGVNTLREVVSKFHSNIVETATGEVIQLSDASDLELAGLRIFGKTEQKMTTGKNLFPLVPFEPKETNGIKVSYESGGIRLSGNLETPESTMFIKNWDDDAKHIYPAGTYTLTFSSMCQPQIVVRFCNESGNNQLLSVQNVSAIRRTFTLNEPFMIGWGVYRNATHNQNLPSEPVFIQVEAGSTATEWEPYTGGKPSPSPDYPQSLESVGESVNVTIEGTDTQLQELTVTTPNGLPGIPVSSGGNHTDVDDKEWICDEIDFEKGMYVQRVREVLVTQTTSTSNSLMILPDTAGAKKPLTIISNYADGAKFGLSDDGEKIFIRGSSNASANRVELTYDALNTLLAETPMVLVYALAEENHIPLSEIDPDALAQYATLHTNYPNTTVYNDVGAGMEVKYVADTQKYVDKKFEALEAAIANLI